MTISSAYFNIDTSKPMPLYYQIQENLIELMDLGLLKAGESLPSERDLSKYYGVNRMTVRQAIDGLVKKGLVNKQHGVGTFVSNQPAVKTFAPAVTGFSQRMREAGLRPSSRVLVSQRMLPSPLISHRLGIPVTEEVYAIQRLRLVNDEPLMIETSYLPYSRFPGLDSHDVGQQSLYQILEDQYGVRVHETEQTLEPTLMTQGEAELLSMSGGQPAMLVRILAFTLDRAPIEFSKSVVRGDRCRYYFRVNTQKPIIS